MKTIFEEMGGTYRQVGDYFIPSITLPDDGEYQIGKYGRMRRSYLKEYRKILYNNYVLEGTLFKHLAEIDQIGNERIENIVSAMAKQEGVCPAMQSHFQTPVVFWRNPPIMQGLLPAVLVLVRIIRFLRYPYHCQQEQLGSSASFREDRQQLLPHRPKGIFIFFVIDYVIGIVRFIFIFIVSIFFIKTVMFISFGIVEHRRPLPSKIFSKKSWLLLSAPTTTTSTAACHWTVTVQCWGSVLPTAHYADISASLSCRKMQGWKPYSRKHRPLIANNAASRSQLTENGCTAHSAVPKAF